MTSLTARILEMLIRVRQFGLTHAPGFPADSRGRELFNLVDGFIEAIQTHTAAQAQHARASKEKTTQKRAAVNALRELMSAISRTARAMARDTPGLEDKFQMPNDKGVQGLLAAARSFLADAEPLKDEFGRRGLASTFVDTLRGRILTVETITSAQAQKSAARIAANVTAEESAQDARGAVRELDAIVRNVYAADEATLAEWESASHIERASRRAEANEPTPPPPPAGA